MRSLHPPWRVHYSLFIIFPLAFFIHIPYIVKVYSVLLNTLFLVEDPPWRMSSWHLHLKTSLLYYKSTTLFFSLAIVHYLFKIEVFIPKRCKKGEVLYPTGELFLFFSVLYRNTRIIPLCHKYSYPGYVIMS